MPIKPHDLFKSLEKQEERVLKKHALYILRLDGSNFRRFTKQFEKPFSKAFEHGMNAAATAVAEALPGALLVYVGSDEISLVYSDAQVETIYGRRVNKLLTIAASHATAGFMRAVPGAQGVPAFDARVIQFDDPELVLEYVTWRRLDVRKNCISMAAETLRSHKELLGVSTAERAALLVGTPFEKIDEGTFNGRFLIEVDGKPVWTPATRELALGMSANVTRIHNEALRNINLAAASR